MSGFESLEDEDLIPEENIIVTLTHNGYIKRLPATTYRSQKRGGRGIQGMGTNEDDFVEHLIDTSTHDTLLFFTNKGKVYRLKGYEIPEYGRTAKGLPIINLLEVEKGERINAIIPVRGLDDDVILVLYNQTRNFEKNTSYHHLLISAHNGLIALGLT